MAIIFGATALAFLVVVPGLLWVSLEAMARTTWEVMANSACLHGLGCVSATPHIRTARAAELGPRMICYKLLG